MIKHQNITLNMIVKNEAHCIHTSLNTIHKYVNYYVVVDTGSTDNTKKVIKEFFDERNISGEIHDRPWKNFGWNRTEAFQCAKGKGDYVWVFDADDEICGELVLPEQLEKDMYSLRYKYNNNGNGTTESWWRPQLFNNILDWRYEGVLHEYVIREESKTYERIEGNYHINPTFTGDRNQDGVNAKMTKDIAVLTEALQKEPDNLRYVFYLAQSYFTLHQYSKAMECYDKRAKAGGWDEEVYVSLWRKALCHGELTGEIPFRFLIEAYEYRPQRFEAPFEIIKSCRAQQKFHFAYALAKELSGKLPAVRDDLFIDASITDWRLQDELSICAYWVGNYEESKDLCFSLLAGNALPYIEQERVKTNLKFALDKLGNSG